MRKLIASRRASRKWLCFAKCPPRGPTRSRRRSRALAPGSPLQDGQVDRRGRWHRLPRAQGLEAQELMERLVETPLDGGFVAREVGERPLVRLECTGQ